MLKKLLTGSVFLFLMSSCMVEDDDILCTTLIDCPDGLICIDGFCVKDEGGDTGDMGNSGDSGNTGDTGNTGMDDQDEVDDQDTGDSGNTGNTGDSGNTGTDVDDEVDDVDTGDSGDTGDTGDTGNTGDTCGDNTVQSPGEVCDGNSVACSAIEGMNYNNDDLVDCNTNCDGWVTENCTCETGYEKDVDGKCVDIDECTTSAHNCHSDADCKNTPGSFTCSCKDYYAGDGVTDCTFCNTATQCGSDCSACEVPTSLCKDNGDNTSVCVECLTNDDCTAPEKCVADSCVNECQYSIELSTTRNYNLGLATVYKDGTSIGDWDATDHPQSKVITFQVTHNSSVTISFVSDNKLSYSYEIKDPSSTVVASGETLNDGPSTFTANCN